MNSILIPDILHRIRQHLPFVDRRELSLVCKDFREPLQEVFREYVELGLSVFYRLYGTKLPSEGYIAGGFMLWVTIELTLEGERIGHVPLIYMYNEHFDRGCYGETICVTTRTVVHPLKYINSVACTDFYKIAYHPTRGLFAKNWGALQSRRALLVPDLARHFERYFAANPAERNGIINDSLSRTMTYILSLVYSITLVPYTDIPRIRKYIDSFHWPGLWETHFPIYPEFVIEMVKRGFSMSSFLDE